MSLCLKRAKLTVQLLCSGMPGDGDDGGGGGGGRQVVEALWVVQSEGLLTVKFAPWLSRI